MCVAQYQFGVLVWCFGKVSVRFSLMPVGSFSLAAHCTLYAIHVEGVAYALDYTDCILSVHFCACFIFIRAGLGAVLIRSFWQK